MEIITSVSDGPTQRGAGEDQVLLGRHRRSVAPTRRNPALQRYVTLISELAVGVMTRPLANCHELREHGACESDCFVFTEHCFTDI